MSEVTDLVMPVLQRIQNDLAEMKRDVAGVRSAQADHGARLEDIEIHLAYLTGIDSQNKFDLNVLKRRIKTAEDRLSDLQPQG